MKSTDAHTRALHHLQGLIATGPTGLKLDSQTKLAARARVSLATMSRAIARLKSAGMLACTPGHGTVIANRARKASALPDPATIAQEKTPVWHSVAVRIETDIFEGRLPRNRKLPSIKQLSATYGANPRTVRKALVQCQRHQSIAVFGNGYRPAYHSIRESAHQILVFVYSETQSLELGYLDTSALRTIESLCRQQAATPRFIRYQFVENGVRYVDHADGRPFTPRAADEMLGAVWLLLFPEHVSSEICTHLLSLRKPVAVHGMNSPGIFPASFRSSPRVRIFVGTADASVYAVRYLAGNGHRHLAFVSAYQGADWCKRRLMGITDATHAIPGVSLNTYLSSAQGSYGSAIPDYGSEVTRIANEVTTGYPWIADANRYELGAFFSVRMQSTMTHTLYLWHLSRNLRPCIDMALHDAQATGWIFGDDDEAVLGLEYLQTLKVAVPGRISVVGVNNSLEAVRHSVSSCGDVFDVSLHSMIDYVCYPATAPRGPVIDVADYVVERGSSGRAP